MNVEKVIRVIGYAVYTALWSPVIVLLLTVTPIVVGGWSIRNGVPFKEGFVAYKDILMKSIQHDAEFIKTGKW